MSKFTDAVERGLKGIKAPSIGVCPGCEKCREMFASEMDMRQFQEAWESGEVHDEGGFDSCECGICGSRKGGDRFIWHWLDDNDEIMHEDDACVDCVMLICNGEEPEVWEP